MSWLGNWCLQSTRNSTDTNHRVKIRQQIWPWNLDTASLTSAKSYQTIWMNCLCAASLLLMYVVCMQCVGLTLACWCAWTWLQIQRPGFQPRLPAAARLCRNLQRHTAPLGCSSMLMQGGVGWRLLLLYTATLLLNAERSWLKGICIGLQPAIQTYKHNTNRQSYKWIHKGSQVCFCWLVIFTDQTIWSLKESPSTQMLQVQKAGFPKKWFATSFSNSADLKRIDQCLFL